MRKGEIARYEQFFLFSQCFRKTCAADTLKPGLVWVWVKLSFADVIALEKSKILSFGKENGPLHELYLYFTVPMLKLAGI